MKTCAVDGCNRERRTGTYCHAHYMRWWYTGNVGGAQIRSRDPVERFWSFVDKTDGCWNWTGTKNHGYGGFSYQGKLIRSHRFSYELHKGPIPDGLTVDHLCRNRACVNPQHLEAVPFAENVRRGRPHRDWSYALGEKNANAVLTEDTVREIRRLKAEGLKVTEIAHRVGFEYQAVYAAMRGRNWSHVT